MNNNYNSNLKTFAKQNRKKSTKGELILWKHLRNKQICGLKFYRQRPIDNYIVDFFQPNLKLIIEIDGPSHTEDKYEYDKRREKELMNLGYKFLRFTESDVFKDTFRVLETIRAFIEESF